MRFLTPSGIALTVCLLSTASTAQAATIDVPAGGDLQAALNAAHPGDVIRLAPGATYEGNFVLPYKGAVTGYITIRSSAPDSALPRAGVRMTPAYASQLPKIKSPNGMAALGTATSANHYKLMFLEFQANQDGFGDIIGLGAGDSTQTQLSQVPYALVLDRVYVHGDPVLGQKRGIALHSSDTTVINSWVSDCKATGQEAQAIGGFNGPGNYLIENNYLEGAAQSLLLGGGDPAIPNLVTTDVTFRRNLLSKPLAWRNSLIATPASVTATAAPGGGTLAAGTYYYKVVARGPAGQTNTARSAPSAVVSATIQTGTGGVTVSWTPVAGATEYVVYGRASGTQNEYWTTTSPFFADTGEAGTSGSAGTATKYIVKNVFELKNAQDVLIEGNVFEHLWVADQPGFPIVFTPRNQGGTAPWVVVQRVMFRNNIVRHTAGGVNILGTDNVQPSQRTNHITIRDNVFDDLTSATWGSGARPFQIGNGADAITIDHNTVITTDSSIVWLYGGSATNPTPITNTVITNNMSAHNSYGIFGSNFSSGTASINAYLPGSIVTKNLLAGGNASKYPAGNFFPTVAVWQGNFVNYATGDYHLLASSTYKGAGTDTKDLGADIDAVNAQTAIALTGDNSGPPSTTGVQIMTTSVPNGTVGAPYAQLLSCTGAVPQCAWQVQAGVLPAGVAFDTTAGRLVGTPTAVETGSVTVLAYDPSSPTNTDTATFTLTIDPPPLVMTMPAPPNGQVGVAYQLTPSVSGAMGSTSWSVVSGGLPVGVNLDGLSGRIAGVPSAWGTTTAVVQVQDSWGTNRTDSKPVTITIAPAPLAIASTTLPGATSQVFYQSALSATGGTGARTWSLSGGALPAGLALSTGGVISGTPTAAGTFTFTVQATDAGWPGPGNVATRPLSLVVGAAREIVLYASDASRVAGTWTAVADATAAGGTRIWNANLGAPKLATALANPVNYFEMTFQAEAGVAYHLWVRGKADANSWSNDSVMVQFSGSVSATGAPMTRIGTTSGADVNLEDCSGCGESGWGWQDNGWGVNVFGPDVYFAQSGTQTIRVQVKEDGFSIDQILLSANRYRTSSPGALKNDTTIVAR